MAGWFGAAGVVALTLGAAVLLPQARAEVITGYLPVGLLIVWRGRAIEDKALGSTGRRPALTALATVTLAVTCCGGPFAFYSFNSDPFVPSADEVLPLPDGLHATVEGGDDPCGSGSCLRTILVTGQAGQPVAEVEARVRRHVGDRGWELDHTGWACRRSGWILDRTTLCVGVHARDAAVHVGLEGSRAWP